MSKENNKTIPLHVVNSQSFTQGIQKVFNKAELDIKTAHKLNKYIKKLEEETKSYQAVVQKFIQDDTKGDEDE